MYGQNVLMKNFLSFVVRLALSGALLYWIFSKIDLEKTWAALRSADPKYLFLSALFFMVTNFIILWRWYVFIKALKLDVSLRNTTRWFFVGLFCNLFLPTSIGGDVIKVIGLCRTTDDKTKVFATVVLDRLSGFAGIVILSIVALLIGHRILDDRSIVISVAILGVLSLGVTAVLFSEQWYSLASRIFSFWPKLKDNLMQVHYDVVLMKGKLKDGVLAIGISVFAQIILALSFYMTAKGLNQDVAFVYFLIFSPLVCVVTTLPSIGGLGVREVGWVYFLGKVGVPQGIAVSMSLINFLFMVIIGVLGGIIYVATLSARRVQHPSPNAALKVSKS